MGKQIYFNYNKCSNFAPILYMLNKGFLNWFIFIILSIIWGSSFIMMKEGLAAFNSIPGCFSTDRFFRYCITALLLLSILKGFPKINC